jgi:hypothetical protein
MMDNFYTYTGDFLHNHVVINHHRPRYIYVA